MRESKIERDILDAGVEKMGGFTRKFTSPGHPGVPDRIVLFFDEVWFIEVKQTKAMPTATQWREIQRYRRLGINAGYLAGERQVNAFLASGNRHKWMEDHINANYK